MSDNESYEQGRARERAAYVAKAKETSELIAAIAKALGGKWNAHKEDDPRVSPDVWGTLELDNMSLWVRANGYGNADRIKFSVNWPTYKGADGHTVTMQGRDCVTREESQKYPWEISVAQSKAPETIAKDVTRRLIEPMRPVWELAIARIESTLQRIATDKARVAKFLKAFPSYSARQSDSGKLYSSKSGMPRVEVGESVRFDDFYCDHDTAVKILKLLESVKREE